MESLRGVEGYERIAERAAELPDTRLVYVADREADILAVMRRAHALGQLADWLIRSQHNRKLSGEADRLWQRGAGAWGNPISAAATPGAQGPPRRPAGAGTAGEPTRRLRGRARIAWNSPAMGSLGSPVSHCWLEG
ncbi:MAG: hypothetical protein FIA97_13505 [Methylococcaceae bacterium]|nr:hypothetical protein [Methylococcaceae bacterium]